MTEKQNCPHSCVCIVKHSQPPLLALVNIVGHPPCVVEHCPPLHCRTLLSPALSNIPPPTLLNIPPLHVVERCSPVLLNIAICPSGVLKCCHPHPLLFALSNSPVVVLSIVNPPCSCCSLSHPTLHCHSLSHPFVLSVSTSISPYKQWLAGRVGALCDVVLDVVQWCCCRLPLSLCCCPEM
jgi:hypothetical protein